MNWSGEGYLALSAVNVKDGFIDSSIDAHYGSKKLYDKWMKGNELHLGQVIFTTEAPMGNVAQVPDNEGYILSQRVIAFSVIDKIITEDFLATVLSSPTSFNRLSLLSSGGTAKGVSQKTLSMFTVTVPQRVEEQKKISKSIKTISKLITHHQRAHLTIYYKGVVKWLIKLEKPTYLLIIILNGLKFIKKALLEKLRCQNIE